MFWSSWQAVTGVLIVGVASYLGLLIVQRLSGKRTLSKLNAFDFVVTVALGSTLATTILSPDVTLADGLVAFAVLALLQLSVTFLSVKWQGFNSAVKASPRRLVHNGRMLTDAMRAERVTEDEILQAVRSSGKSTLQGMDVVLETNGKLSVIPKGDGPHDAMGNVR